MSDNLPGHTCPAIDSIKRTVRRWAREHGIDPIEVRAVIDDLEELRAAHSGLREGYARAMGARGKCSHCGRWG